MTTAIAWVGGVGAAADLIRPFLAGADKIEAAPVVERRPPRRDAGLLVGVMHEGVAVRRRDAEDQLVGAWPVETHIGAVMGAVGRDHRMEQARARPVAALLGQREAYRQVGHP